MESTVGLELVTKNGPVQTSSISPKEVVLLYFSAHWCPPCRNFTPKLAAFYNEVNATEKQVEIIFISLDRSPPDFEQYYNEMPWSTIPYGSEFRQSTPAKFGVTGIPSLILVDQQGNPLETGCRGDVESEPPAATLAKWKHLSGLS